MSFVKGQSAIEYFTIVGIGLLIATPFIVLVQDDVISLQTDSADARFSASLDEMENAVERADALGEPASTSFTLNVPGGIESSTIESDFVVFTQNRSGQASNITRRMETDIVGNLPRERGSYPGTATARENYVEISFDGLEGLELPDFDIISVSDNRPVTEGDNVNVDYTVENIGDVSDTQDIVLQVEGVQEDVDSDVSLNSGSSTSDSLIWSTSSGDAGSTYSYTLYTENDSVSGTVSVGSLSGPTASASVNDSNPDAGQTVQFDASSSTEGDGSITSYDWDVDEDGSYEKSGPTVTHSYGAGGSRSVELNITDSNGLSDTDTLAVDVADSTGSSFTLLTTENYVFTGSKVVVDLDNDFSQSVDNITIVEMHGADGSDSSDYNGGSGGFIANASADVSSYSQLSIWVGETTGDETAGWGRSNGGSGGFSFGPPGGGGGSTEIWTDSESQLVAAADAGAGGSLDGTDRGDGGGGGARGGAGASGGSPAGGVGFGGDATIAGAGGDGGQELGLASLDSGGVMTDGGSKAGSGEIVIEYYTQN